MKKLLGIVVLGLFLSSNANSKIIVLKKCSLGDAYEKWNYKIDTSKSRITEVRVYSVVAPASRANLARFP